MISKQSPTHAPLLLSLLVLLVAIGCNPNPPAAPQAQTRNTETPSPIETIPPVPTQNSVATPVPMPSSPTGQIALVDTEGHLILVDPATQTQAVLDDKNRYQFPAWSPDDTHIAAIGRNRAGTGVFDFNLAADTTTLLYFDGANNPIYLSWSPNGRYLSFIANNDGNGLALWLSETDAPNSASILHTGQPLYWDWAEDSSRLFFHTGGASLDSELGYLTRDGDIETDTYGRAGRFQSPDINPTNGQLAYAEIRARLNGLVIDPNDGSDTTFLAHAGTIALAWNQSGQQLAYTAGQRANDAYGPLYLYDPTLNQETLIADEQVIAFFWSPDGQKIAYITPQLGGGQQANAARTRSSKRLPVQQNSVLRLNLTVYDLVSDQPQFITTFEPTQLFFTQFLPFFDQYARSHRLWSPNSDYFLMPMRQDGAPVIKMLGLDGTAVNLGAGFSAFWSHGDTQK